MNTCAWCEGKGVVGKMLPAEQPDAVSVLGRSIPIIGTMVDQPCPHCQSQDVRTNMKRQTVAEMWDEFWTAVKPQGPVSRDQLIDMRRAFYAGIYSMLAVNCKTGSPEVSEDDAVAWITSIRKECRQFADDVKAGKA